MATENQMGMPQSVLDALKQMGYQPDSTMRKTIEGWWNWYTANASWYDSTQDIDGRTFRVRRHTLHPARRVCEEWASIILDDDGTKLGTDVESVTDLLDAWAGETRFVSIAQRCLGRAFGVGTGALALWFDVQADGTVDIRARSYDARMILPLSWDDNGVTECAFVTRAYVDGIEVNQLQVHELSDETSTYHVITRMFDADKGKEVRRDGIIEDFDTLSDSPTFAILRPAIDNVYAEGTYMGQALIADAIDAIKGVDGAYDSLIREIDATKVKVFMSDELFDMQTDPTGKMRPVPMSPENTVIRKVSDAGISHMYEVYSPAIRSAQLIESLNAALSQMGSLTGFGPDYFRFDKSGGLRTATEVASDNSVLMRNIRKHENELRPQLEGLLSALLACQRQLNPSTWSVPEGCDVTVDFDDSIIQDTASEKAQMQAEVAQGIVPAWKYLVRFYGMGEEEAKATAAGPEVLDVGA
ncbi:MAG: phage portal protein [Atopobiaceae bacterium]|nr:phage portal protein [Atopobiaceae bacterium]